MPAGQSLPESVPAVPTVTPGDPGARTLGALRALIFVHMASAGLLIPYLAPFLESKELSGGTQGGLFAMRTAVGTALGPLLGLAADRWGAHRVLRITAGLAAAAAFALLQVEAAAGFAAAFLLSAAGTSAVAPLADAAILGVLERAPAGSRLGGPTSYGRSRLFGSIGFALAALGFGVLFRDASSGEAARFAMIAVAGLATTAFLLAFRVHVAAAMIRRPSLSDVPRLLRLKGVGLLLLCTALQWVTLAPYHAFFGAHVQHHGGTPNTIGISVAVAVAVEIWVMATAPRWLSLLAPRHVLAVSAIAGVLRWSITAVGSPGWIIAAQALHGLSYGAFYIAVVDAIVRRTPASLRATAQTLLVAAGLGLGTLVGNLAAGGLYELDHGRTLFLAAALFSVAPAAVALAVGPPPAVRPE